MNIDFTHIGTFTVKVTEQWITVHDHNGDQIYYISPDGYEEWCEYNSNHKVINFKNTEHDDACWEYDERGHIIHYTESDGYEEWSEFNDSDIMIHYKNSLGAIY